MVFARKFQFHRLPPDYWLTLIAGVSTFFGVLFMAGGLFFAQMALTAWLLLLLVLGQSLAVFLLHTHLRRQDQTFGQRQARLTTQLREAAAQEERNRLARDLHDTIKQQLFSINVAAATAQSLYARDADGASIQVQKVRDLAQAAMVEMKALLTQLRPQPLATVGLVAAIREQLESLHFRAEVTTTLQSDPLPDETQLPLGAQEAIFRVVQEALANVARHARARQVHVQLTKQEKLFVVTIRDNGQGFDQQAATGMGIANMRSRLEELGGKLAIESAPGQGCQLQAAIPLLTQPGTVDQALVNQRAQRYDAVVTGILGMSFVLQVLVKPAMSLWEVALVWGAVIIFIGFISYHCIRLYAIAPPYTQWWLAALTLTMTGMAAFAFVRISRLELETQGRSFLFWCVVFLLSYGLAILSSQQLRRDVRQWTTFAHEEKSLRYRWLSFILLAYALMASANVIGDLFTGTLRVGDAVGLFMIWSTFLYFTTFYIHAHLNIRRLQKQSLTPTSIQTAG